MTIKLNDFGGSGASFIPTYHSGLQEIAVGQSGTILTLTPPTGERVRMTMFSPEYGRTVEDLQLNLDGSQICVGDCTSECVATGDWCVSAPGAANDTPQNGFFSGYIPGLMGGVDEVITVVVTGVDTAQLLYYGYQTGELR